MPAYCGDFLARTAVHVVGLGVRQDLTHLGDDDRGCHAARHFAGVIAAHAVGEHHQPVHGICGNRVLVVRAHHARVGARRDFEALAEIHQFKQPACGKPWFKDRPSR